MGWTVTDEYGNILYGELVANMPLVFVDCVPGDRTLAEWTAVSGAEPVHVSAHLEYIHERRFDQLRYVATPEDVFVPGTYRVDSGDDQYLVRCLCPILGGGPYVRLGYGFSRVYLKHGGTTHGLTSVRSWNTVATCPGRWTKLGDTALPFWERFARWRSHRKTWHLAVTVCTLGIFRPRMKKRDPWRRYVFVPEQLVFLINGEHRARHTKEDDIARAGNWMRNNLKQVVPGTEDSLLALSTIIPHVDYTGRRAVYDDYFAAHTWKERQIVGEAGVTATGCCF